MDNLNEALGFLLVGTLVPVLFVGMTGTPIALAVWVLAVACYLMAQPPREP